MRTVVGLFDQFEHAQMAVNDLKSAGFAGEDISLVANDANSQLSRQLVSDVGDRSKTENLADGTAAGVGVGAVLGGIGGFLLGLGALAIPGIGPVLAAGPIAAAIVGAGTGAVAGGLLGALVNIGIPDENAGMYAEGIRRGGTLVVVRTQDDQTDRVVTILNSHNPVDMENRANEWRSNNWKGFNPNAEPMNSDEKEFKETE